VLVPSYRCLDAWAERDQRRLEQRQSTPPRAPGSEPAALRVLVGGLGTFAMALKFVTIPGMLIWAVRLAVQHTLRSLLLALVVLMLASFSVFTTTVLVQARREHGRNWFTGLAPRARRRRRGPRG
jgi:hypothetical protein